MNSFPFSGPRFRAAIDVLQLLEEAASIKERLGDDEIHSLCYFARLVAAATSAVADISPAQLPYTFTLGRNGGPFSNDMASALEELSILGWCLREAIDENHDVYLYSAAPASANVLAQLSESSGDGHGVEQYLRSIIRSMILRPLPLVVSAVRSEPSLVRARASGVHSELPLSADDFVVLVKKVSSSIDELSVGAGANPRFLVPAILDVLSNATSY